MKNMRLLSGLLLSAIIFCSCGKDDTTTPTTKVEYRISNGSNIITQVQYNDSTGSTITATGVTTDWSKVTYVLKPFVAAEVISVNNPQGSTLRPVLTILVNDTVKATREVQVAPMSQSNETLAYTVQ